MAKVRQNLIPVISFKVGSGSAIDFGADCASFEWADGDGNVITFSDAKAGTPAQLNATFVLDFAVTKTYEFLATNLGAAGVTYIVQHDSGSAVSQNNPKFTGTLTLPATLPRYSSEASEDPTDFITFDVEFALDSQTKAIS